MPKAQSRGVTEKVISTAPLAKEITRVIKERGLTQTEASYIVKDAPSQLSLISTGKLRGFSAERLIRTLTRLGRDVHITIRPSQRKAGRVRLVIR